MANEPQVFDPNQARTQIGDALLKASVLVVDDPESARQARELRRMAKLLYGVAEAHYKKIKKPMNTAIKAIRDEENKDLEPMEQLIEMLDPKILAYEEEEARRTEQLRADLEQRAKESAQQARNKEIERLLAAGRKEQAEELRKQPLFIPPIVMPERRDWLEGEGRNEKWKVKEETIDIVALAKAVIDGRVPPAVLAPNMKTLDAMADALKETFDIPGCEAYRRVTITQRAE